MGAINEKIALVDFGCNVTSLVRTRFIPEFAKTENKATTERITLN